MVKSGKNVASSSIQMARYMYCTFYAYHNQIVTGFKTWHFWYIFSIDFRLTNLYGILHTFYNHSVINYRLILVFLIRFM